MVKGYAERKVNADQGSLTVRISEKGKDNSEAYEKAGTSLMTVRKIIVDTLGEESELVELSSSISETKKLNEKEIEPMRSILSPLLVFFVSTVRRSRNSGKCHENFTISMQRIRLTLSGPEFFVSKLDEVKIDLMKRATENGRDRAKIMAKSSGEDLGSLVSARQGVIQITKPNSPGPPVMEYMTLKRLKK